MWYKLYINPTVGKFRCHEFETKAEFYIENLKTKHKCIVYFQIV